MAILWNAALCCVGVLGLLLIGLAALVTDDDQRRSDMVRGLVKISCWLLVFIVSMRFVVNGLRANQLGKALRSYLIEHHCLSCGHPLADLSPTDGMIRCPKCGEQNEARLLGIRDEEAGNEPIG